MPDNVIRVAQEDWMQELDGLRRQTSIRRNLKPEEFAYLDYARSEDPPVAWERLCKAFRARFGWGGRDLIRDLYKEQKNES